MGISPILFLDQLRWSDQVFAVIVLNLPVVVAAFWVCGVFWLSADFAVFACGVEGGTKCTLQTWTV